MEHERTLQIELRKSDSNYFANGVLITAREYCDDFILGDNFEQTKVQAKARNGRKISLKTHGISRFISGFL